MQHHLTPATAERFAEIALGHVAREYPHKLDHVMEGPEDVLSPRALHPILDRAPGSLAGKDKAPWRSASRDDAGRANGIRGRNAAPFDPGHCRAFRRDRTWACRARISAQARSCDGGAGGRAFPARAPSDL